jgi:2'-5' RNA ligase
MRASATDAMLDPRKFHFRSPIGSTDGCVVASLTLTLVSKPGWMAREPWVDPIAGRQIGGPPPRPASRLSIMETTTQTALIVAVPEAEAAVGPFRASLDRAAGWGVPAHVTVLYPFLAPARLGEDVLAALGEVFAAVPRFDVAFDRVAWFGENVVWLAPSPDRPFRDLTAAVVGRFPETPPYEGAFGDEVVPHLTIGHDAPLAVLTKAGEAVAAQLPIHASVGAVRLIAGTPAPDSWRSVAEFPLGPRA